MLTAMNLVPVGGGDYTIKQEHDCKEINGRCDTVTGVVNSVATNGEAGLVWVELLWPVEQTIKWS